MTPSAGPRRAHTGASVATLRRMMANCDSELNWTFLSFMSLATLIAGVAIVLDSQVLVIGAMVLGPEFGAIAALGVALVRRRTVLARGRGQGPSGRLRGGDRRDLPRRPRRTRPRLGDARGHHRPAAGDGLHLLARPVDLRRRRPRGSGRRALAHLGQARRPQRRLHLRDDDPRRGQRRVSASPSGPGRRSAAADCSSCSTLSPWPSPGARRSPSRRQCGRGCLPRDGRTPGSATGSTPTRRRPPAGPPLRDVCRRAPGRG